MKLNKPENQNYCATVVMIQNIIPLDGCDNVVATRIMGNQVIISKYVSVGDIGLFFPVETELSKEYLSANNLYRKSELNIDNTQKGYFDENGRIKCIKFRGHNSEGLFMPLKSLSFTLGISVDNYSGILNEHDEFDKINNIHICQKYIPKYNRTQGFNSKDKKSKQPKVSKIVDNQFRFHNDTSQLYKNLHCINPSDLIHISYKIHGTSGISAKILCNRNLSLIERIAKNVFKLNIKSTQYDYVNSSRKVLKNDDFNPNPAGYYNEDIWSIVDKELRQFLVDGMTLYYEIVGFLPSGSGIQGVFDYGCEAKQHKIFIYRITITNISGKVFEFSAKQVQDWCKKNGLVAVPQLYYGFAKDIFSVGSDLQIDAWRMLFLSQIKYLYNEHDCYICNNIVPEEGCVIRIEGIEFEAYKCKSTRFLEYETKQLDKGIVDIETEN
jgi:hypothetical protein